MGTSHESQEIANHSTVLKRARRSASTITPSEVLSLWPDKRSRESTNVGEVGPTIPKIGQVISSTGFWKVGSDGQTGIILNSTETSSRSHIVHGRGEQVQGVKGRTHARSNQEAPELAGRF